MPTPLAASAPARDAAGPKPSVPSSADALVQIATGAATLDERLDAVGPQPGEPDDSALSTWVRAFCPAEPAALRRRLEWERRTPQQAVRALEAIGGPGVALAPAVEPEWLQRARATLAAGAAEPLRTAEAGAATRDLPFAEFWTPWVAGALRRLDDEIPGDLLPAGSRAALARGLAEELVAAAGLAAGERLRAARQADPRPGAWQRLAAAESGAEVLLGWKEYPVAARQLARLVDTWVESLIELAVRLARDRAAIGQRFLGGADPGRPVVVTRADSDRHADGRGVFRVEFAGGLVLAYKPRSLAVEAGWERFLADLAALGVADLPPAAPVLDCDDCGWMRWVEPAELPDEAAAAAWFRRAGTLVALAELLGSEDLHAENLIAAATGPVVIDAEMLLQPERVRGGRRDRFAGGLLRRRGEDDRVAAWAGLEPVVERLLPGRGRGWTAVGTDEIAPAPVELRTRPLGNAPRFGGRALAPAERADDLVAGHRAAWSCLLARREELLRADGPLAHFAGAPVRVLLRASQDYAQVLDLLRQPRHQRDGAAAGLLLEALARPLAGSASRPLAWDLVTAERQALSGLDVPRFEAAADGLELRHGAVSARGLLATSALDAVRARLGELTESAIERRVAAVAAALAPPPARRVSCEPSGAATPLARALELADRIAAFDSELAAGAERSVTAGERLLDLALYDGRMGRALVLAAADRRDGGSRWGSRRDALLHELERWRATVKAANDDWSIGALTGLGSLVWGLVALARATDDRTLLEPAATLADQLTEARLAADRRFDLEGGAAGAVLALLALAEASGERRWLDRARFAGARLAAAAVAQPEGGIGWPAEGGTALAGFAHGAAGIVRALQALARHAEADAAALAPVIDGGLAFERALFDPQRGNWPTRDARASAADALRSGPWMTAWCHGAPGIGLGRLLAAPPDGSHRGGEEVAVAAAAIAAAGDGSFDHLCCGAAGRWGILARLAEGMNRSDWADAARRGATALLERTLRLPRSPREPEAAEAGLFRGLGGAAWLTLAAGDADLLDPLALELPSEAERRRQAGRPLR